MVRLTKEQERLLRSPLADSGFNVADCARAYAKGIRTLNDLLDTDWLTAVDIIDGKEIRRVLRAVGLYQPPGTTFAKAEALEPQQTTAR